MTTALIVFPTSLEPESIFPPTPKAVQRVVEFFTAQAINDNMRKA